MALRTQWPYAAKANIQHEWDTDHLNVWVTFKFPMQTTSDPLATPIVHDVMPPLDLWICEVNGVPKAVTVSAWQDEWTILLTVPDVLALPSRVTLEYAGPSENLRITWDKQWEPWGPILSIRVPYSWKDILVVDTNLKRVGIQPGVAATDPFAWALTIVSPDGTAQVGLSHDTNGVMDYKAPTAHRFDSPVEFGNRFRCVQIGDAGYLINNAEYDGGWKYIVTDEAVLLSLTADGGMNFFTAPSGTAGTIPSWGLRMQIKNDGGILMYDLPTSDPHVANELWNDGGTLKVSAG